MIRPYRPSDKAQVVELLRLNTPQYFHPSEETDLIYYLDKEIEHYFLVETQDKIVGSGGYNFPKGPETAYISWDMVHPLYQGRGIGKRLIQFRLEKIKNDPSVRNIKVRTSQHVFRFYERQGFVLQQVEKDHWAPAMDLYILEMKV